mmetsp:Transcript_19172/g.38630  ORF Transcript_19172/g.38630 Transcript_19172/m.38630 type:complete len:83 (+) Transcript_19172:3589-3837(+)
MVADNRACTSPDATAALDECSEDSKMYVKIQQLLLSEERRKVRYVTTLLSVRSSRRREYFRAIIRKCSQVASSRCHRAPVDF